MTWSLSVSGNCANPEEETVLIEKARAAVAELPGMNAGYLATQHHGSVNLKEAAPAKAGGEVKDEQAG